MNNALALFSAELKMLMASTLTTRADRSLWADITPSKGRADARQIQQAVDNMLLYAIDALCDGCEQRCLRDDRGNNVYLTYYPLNMAFRLWNGALQHKNDGVMAAVAVSAHGALEHFLMNHPNDVRQWTQRDALDDVVITDFIRAYYGECGDVRPPIWGDEDSSTLRYRDLSSDETSPYEDPLVKLYTDVTEPVNDKITETLFYAGCVNASERYHDFSFRWLTSDALYVAFGFDPDDAFELSQQCRDAISHFLHALSPSADRHRETLG